MSETVSTSSVQDFVVEIQHPQNCDVVLQSIPGSRLRSKISPVITNVDGTQRAPQLNQNSLPQLPGMRIAVSPEKLAYKILDPLNTDEEALARLEGYLNRIGAVQKGKKVKGEEPLTGQLDQNRMKTLCRELLSLVEDGQAVVVRGPSFTLKNVEDLPGRFLLNPGSRVSNTQPTFEDEYDSWVERLTRSGAG